jgi:hypothetical protein
MNWEALERQANEIDDALETYAAAPTPLAVRVLLENTSKMLHRIVFEMFEDYQNELRRSETQ